MKRDDPTPLDYATPVKSPAALKIATRIIGAIVAAAFTVAGVTMAIFGAPVLWDVISGSPEIPTRDRMYFLLIGVVLSVGGVLICFVALLYLMRLRWD